MIRIISSRKLRFYSPDRQESVVTEGKNIIQTVPDWAAQDGMFKLAERSGIISVLNSKIEEKKAENEPEKVVPQNAHEKAPKLKEETVEEPTWEPGGGAKVEEPELIEEMFL